MLPEFETEDSSVKLTLVFTVVVAVFSARSLYFRSSKILFILMSNSVVFLRGS